MLCAANSLGAQATGSAMPCGDGADASIVSTIRAALGDHDDTNQVLYEPFNMGGKRF